MPGRVLGLQAAKEEAGTFSFIWRPYLIDVGGSGGSSAV